jgi:hypothetical protein
MEQENIKADCVHCNHRRCRNNNQGAAGAVYGLGLIGAAIYYIQHAGTFWIGVLGILKAIVWPVILIYNLFGFLKP